jgi:3-oxoacyl-[acyl-carrier protein] reductase
MPQITMPELTRSSTQPLTGRTALITGGARGIGLTIARRFAQAGADCVLFDLDAQSLEQAASEIHALGRKAEFFQVNVTKGDEVSSAVEKTLDKVGRVDILINNAGITRDGLILRMSEDDWDAVLSVNLRGAFLATKAVARSMMKQRYGRIINIASIIGVMGNAGQANYAASKAGLIGLTKSTAKEFASRGVTCNAIAPGFIQTDMTHALPEETRKRLQEHIPMGTLGEPIDVAEAALFLVSDAARYITGQVLVVDGGMVM